MKVEAESLSGHDAIILMRSLAQKSFWAFCSLLGNARINELEHRKLCDVLDAFEAQDETRIIFIEAPRDTLKTTITSVLFPLWLLVRRPSERILLDSHTHAQSKERLRAIQAIIGASHELGACFPGLGSDGYTCNLQEFIVGTRTDFSIKEASVMTGGMDVEQTGRHCDWRIIDDLTSEKNCSTQEQFSATVFYLRSTIPLMSYVEGTKASKIVYVYTPRGEMDASVWFSSLKVPAMRYSRHAYDPIDMDIVQYKTEAEFVADGGTLLFPKSLPFSALLFSRQVMDRQLFMSQYQCYVMPGKDRKFKSELVRAVERKNLPAPLRVFITIDPAGDPTALSGAKKDGDNVAIVVTGFDAKESMYVMDAIFGRFTESETVTHLDALCRTYSPYVVGIEKSGLGNIANHIRAKNRAAGVGVMVDDILPRGRSKFSRISELSSPLDSGRVWAVSDMRGKEQLLWELDRIRFDGGMPGKVDVVDALSMSLDLLKKYGRPYSDADGFEERPILPMDRTSVVWREFHVSEGNREAHAFWG